MLDIDIYIHKGENDFYDATFLRVFSSFSPHFGPI